MNDILEYKGYYANIHFSANDEVFYGKLIGINDLVSFEGDLVIDVISAFKEARNDFLETFQQLGKSPDKSVHEAF